MTRRLSIIDRIATLVVGLLLVVGGFALLDWRYGWVGSWQNSLSTSGFADTESTSWWPWAYAAAGVLLGLVGLVWLIAHAPRRGERAVRLSDASDESGTIRVDLGSVAKAVAADFEARTAVTHVSGTAHRRGGHHVIELRGQLDPLATGSGIESAAARCAQNVSEAFPDGTTVCRVLLGGTRRRPRTSRASTPRVH